jgi:hypothetical protein
MGNGGGVNVHDSHRYCEDSTLIVRSQDHVGRMKDLEVEFRESHGMTD